MIAVGVVLGGVFAYSGFAKLLRLDLSRDGARGLGVPAPLVGTVGVLIPLAELVIAAMLLTPARRLGAALAATLLLTFSVVIAANLARGKRPTCNCFGVRSTQPIGSPTLVRNGALLVAALAVAWLG